MVVMAIARMIDISNSQSDWLRDTQRRLFSRCTVAMLPQSATAWHLDPKYLRGRKPLGRAFGELQRFPAYWITR
jgi:hypothetical protein